MTLQELNEIKLQHWRRVCDELEGPPHPFDLVLVYQCLLLTPPSRALVWINVGGK